MTMTRQHFALIADVVRKLGTHLGPLECANMTPVQRESLAKFFVGELRSTNPNFNRERFLKACGVED